MEIRVQKWGNSMGIRIPSSILKSLKINNNELLEIKEEDDRIIITKSKEQRVSLKKLFDEYNGDKYISSFEWDEPKGREIW